MQRRETGSYLQSLCYLLGMDQNCKANGKKIIAQEREERLASALRENLKRRKDQARARQSGASPDDPPSGLDEGPNHPRRP
jgi:hypothetical protein